MQKWFLFHKKFSKNILNVPKLFLGNKNSIFKISQKMEDITNQLPTKHGRSKLNSSYKDQFLQEISSYVHETDFLINNPTNEGNSSTRKTKETIISTENIPPESDDPYHKRSSQIPKRTKAQPTNQKKSLIPTPTRNSKKNARKIETKNPGFKENSAIVPLNDDDLMHFFDFNPGSISNDESSAQPSPEKIRSEINQKKRSKSPGPRLNSNNRNSITEKQPAKRSKSPSVVRRKARKTAKARNSSPKISNSKNLEEKSLTPTTNNDFNDNYQEDDEEFENEEYFQTPQSDKAQKTKNIFSSPNKNKSPISEKKISTESEGNSPRKIINPPPPHHQDFLDDIGDKFRQKKTNRISKSETPEANLYSIEGKPKKRQTNKNRKKNSLFRHSKFSKNSDDYDNSEDNDDSYNNEIENKKLTDFDIQKMKSGWSAPNVQGYLSSSPNQSSNSISNTIKDNQIKHKKEVSLDDDKKLDNKYLSSESPNSKNAFENLKSSDDSESENEQNSNLISFPKETKNGLNQINTNFVPENSNKAVTINNNTNTKANNDIDLISFSPMKPHKVDDLILFSEHSAIKDETPKSKRIPNSPLNQKDKNDEQEKTEKANNEELTPSHLFFVNANSENSEVDDYSPIKSSNNSKLQSAIPNNNTNTNNNEEDNDNNKTNSDLMGFTEIEIKNDIPPYPIHKQEIIPIEPINMNDSKDNEPEQNTSPKKIITDSLIAEFLDFGGNSPQKIPKNDNEVITKHDNNKENEDSKNNQNKSEITHSNLINLSTEEQTEMMNDKNNSSNEKENNRALNDHGNNDFDNSEVVLSSSSLLSPTKPTQEKEKTDESEDNATNQIEENHNNTENSNFISFSIVENNPNPQNMKQISPTSPPKIEIISFSDSTDPNIIPPEKMNLSIFNSPLKPGESRDNNKYRLDSSDILNFSKNSTESRKQNKNESANNNNISSSSLLQNNYDNQPNNQTASNELSEYSEKADSELVDSPDRGNYNDLFKSPIKMNYLNAKKTYGTTLFSMELSPNNNTNDSLSISKTKNINGSLSPKSESAFGSAAASNSALSSSSPNKHVRRQPKKAISILNRHFVSIEEETSSSQLASSTVDAKNPQQKEIKSPTIPSESNINAKKNEPLDKNNDQEDFNSEFNKFVTGDQNALLKTYENSEVNSTFNNETDKNKENENQNTNLDISQNDDINAPEVINIEEEEEVGETSSLINNSKEGIRENEEENLESNEFANENILQTENNIEEEYTPTNNQNTNEGKTQQYPYSIELDSIPTLPSVSNNNEIGIGSTKAKRLTDEEATAMQKKILSQFGNDTETETETDNYIKYENKNQNENIKTRNDYEGYRKKKPTSAFMVSQNDYSYSELDSENKYAKANNNQDFEEEEMIEDKDEKENDISDENDINNENDINEENEIGDENDIGDEDEETMNKDETSIIDSELAEAIAERNFTSQVIHDLVHSITGVPKKASKNRNLNGSLNNSGNLNNTSMIENEDTIFAFQERFVSIIEVEILTNEGETVNIFPTNLNDYLKDRDSFLSEEKKEKETKPKSNITKSSKKQIKGDNSKKNQSNNNESTDTNKSPKENHKSPARNKSPSKSSFVKSPSNYASPYKGPSPKKKINDKSPSKQSLNNKQSPSQLGKSPKSSDIPGPKKQNLKKQRDIIDPFSAVKSNQQKQTKKGNQKEKQNNKKTLADSEKELENENQFEAEENENTTELENENQGFVDDSNDEFISVSTPTRSPKSSRSSTPTKEKNRKKSPSSQRASNNNNDFENNNEDDQFDDFVNVSTPKKKQAKSINSNTNSPYNKKQAGSNKKNSNLSKNTNKKTPNSSNSKNTKSSKQNQLSHSNNEDPSDLDEFTPVQTHQVTKKINNSNFTPSPSPFVNNSSTKPKRIESDSGDSFLNASNNNSEVNSSSILIENNTNNVDPDEFVSVSANATPQKVDVNMNVNSNTNSSSNTTKAKNTINSKSPLKENATNSNKKKQPARKSLTKKQSTTSSSDDFIQQQDNQTTGTNQQQRQKGTNNNTNNNATNKKKPTNTNSTRMKPGLLGHANSSSSNNSNNQTTTSTSSSGNNKKESNDNNNHQNPFAKGKNKGLQFALRKPLKKVTTVNKKPQQNNEKEEVFDDEDEDMNNNENIENEGNFEQEAFEDEEPQQPTSNKQPQTNNKKNLFSKPQKPKQNEVSPASQQPKSPKVNSNKKKSQLLSPKTIEDPFKALKASKQQQPAQQISNGSGRKKKGAFQPITKTGNNQSASAGNKRKKNQTSLSTGNPPNKKNINNDLNDASTSSSSFQLAFNIDTTLFSDANFQKRQLMPQASPNKKPKTLASVLISADDDYSED